MESPESGRITAESIRRVIDAIWAGSNGSTRKMVVHPQLARALYDEVQNAAGPVTRMIWERAQRHYEETGRPEVHVTPQEFSGLKEEAFYGEGDMSETRLPYGGEIGMFSAIAVIVDYPK